MSSLSIIQLRSALLEVKARFERMLSDTVNAIHHDGSYAAWTWKLSDNLSAREQAAQTLANIYHQGEHTDGREVEVNPGLVLSSAPTLAAINEFNRVKAELQVILTEMDRLGAGSGNDDSFARTIMSGCGWGRLHRKQAVRKIPIITDEVVKVGFIWAHTRDIQRINIAKAHSLLEKFEKNTHIERQSQLLDGLSPNEVLAVVKQSSLHIRANLLVRADQLNRKQIRAHVPFFLAYEKNKSIPPFSPPKISSERDPLRLKRFDIKIEEYPFLPSINAYRYLPEYR